MVSCTSSQTYQYWPLFLELFYKHPVLSSSLIMIVSWINCNMQDLCIAFLFKRYTLCAWVPNSNDWVLALVIKLIAISVASNTRFLRVKTCFCGYWKIQPCEVFRRLLRLLFSFFLSFILNLRPFLYKLWTETQLSKLSGDQSLFSNAMASNSLFTERLNSFGSCPRSVTIFRFLNLVKEKMVHKLL